ncbi:MAG: hypothetical protein ON057_000862 [Glomeribacter sp. 1016415]|nr:hypothetical protein [Glomeribacter sp. 1016415]
MEELKNDLDDWLSYYNNHRIITLFYTLFL